jgi:lipopolysaccharide transport system permease protein
MLSYFQGIWKCRYFWMSLVQMDLRARYRGSVLGIGWSLLHPIAMTVVLSTVFCNMFKADWHDFAPYALAGLAVWSFITTTTTMGCQAFFQNESYIRQCPMPMAIYPLRTVLGTTFHLLIALTVVLLPLTAVAKGFDPGVVFLNLVPTVLLLFLLGWSMATLGGLANVYFQDSQHLADVAFQIMFYMAPIFYPEKLVRENPVLEWVVAFNPFVPFLQLVREPVLHGRMPEALVYLKATVFVAVMAGLASYALSRLQKKLIFQL